MLWLFIASFLIIFCFAFVLLVGAPYVPTLPEQSEIAMELIDLKPGDVLLELGSGDGKILIAAAQRGWNAVGIELNPILVLVSRLRTWRYRKQVKVVWGNLWHSHEWPQSQGIFVFLLPRYMEKLDLEISKWHTQPVTLVSFAFPIPHKQTKRKHKLGVYVYEYK